MAGQTWKADSAAYITAAPGDAWAREAARRGRRGTQRILEVEEAVPPEEVATALGLPAGEPAIVRRRVMHLDDVPIELTDSYYPAGIARGTRLADPRKIPGGAVSLLATMGHEVRSVTEDVQVDAASPRACRELFLAEGAPVLLLTRTSFDADRRPIEVCVMTMVRGTHLTYHTEIG